ncbi:N-acetylneuraminate synthase family protein [Polaribacter sp. Hel1_85]|uniref:N-acetylneuraminate synthase family protein n=1 Tax=Polaribacter sp. Hel1_85 TaxID=1250005 RepID=UPI00052BFDD0|nr:N-acetylneuraminate synthase family protein [Polaribacter sp. Hel1_85]KGL62087.1 sialic acid synthase [Polaribacter sp. Hel1_85]
MTYIIGEIGQNHNGSVDLCKLMVDVAARPVKDNLFGKDLKQMDAVKLTKRDLSQELSSTQMKSLYNSPHSFGKTYGEHRSFLELNDEQHFEVYQYTKKKGLDFVETLCAIGCLSMLKLFIPDKLKVASRDLTNLPLLSALAETEIPIIVSTGMAGEKELNQALETINKYHQNISILHCVSEYPTRYENVNLKTITYLQKNYPQYTIGYSDHTIGISTPIAAVAMGAEIIEKHITLDRSMKGTDQKGSLAIDGIYRMIRDIRNLDMSMGEEKIEIVNSVESARNKLERSIAANKDLKKGALISEKDIHLLSPGDGVKWIDKDKLIGKTLSLDIPKDEIIYLNKIK